MSTRMSHAARRPLAVSLAAIGALTIALASPIAASAATVDGAVVNGSSPSAIYTGATGSNTVVLDGSGFKYNPAWAGPVFVTAGIYVAFGPDVAISSAYADASQFSATEGGVIWAHNGAAAASNQWELSTAGVFTDLPLTVESTFTDGYGDDFTCTTGPADTTAGSVDCFIYTFSGHGSTDRTNDNKIPVYFG